MRPTLGLGGPQSLALQCQAPWEGPLSGRPRVRVCPQEAGRLIRPLCNERRSGLR